MKSLTKSFVVRLSLLVLPLSLSAVEVDGVVATVGTESILKSDVIGEMRRAGADDSQFVEVRNRLIERKLILKAAKKPAAKTTKKSAAKKPAAEKKAKSGAAALKKKAASPSKKKA